MERSGRWPPDSTLLACTLFLSGLCPRCVYVAVCSRSGPLTVSRPGLAVLVGYKYVHVHMHTRQAS